MACLGFGIPFSNIGKNLEEAGGRPGRDMKLQGGETGIVRQCGGFEEFRLNEGCQDLKCLQIVNGNGGGEGRGEFLPGTKRQDHDIF